MVWLDTNINVQQLQEGDGLANPHHQPDSIKRVDHWICVSDRDGHSESEPHQSACLRSAAKYNWDTLIVCAKITPNKRLNCSREVQPHRVLWDLQEVLFSTYKKYHGTYRKHVDTYRKACIILFYWSSSKKNWNLWSLHSQSCIYSQYMRFSCNPHTNVIRQKLNPLGCG